jgi:dipeptidyl aminopeptidase/acylaminoacyl peptidase
LVKFTGVKIKMVDWQATDFIPHPHAEVVRGVLPSEIPETVYAQWCIKYAALSTNIRTQRIVYRSDGLNVTGLLVQPTIIPPEGLPLLIFNRGGSGRYGMLTVLQVLYLLEPLASKGYIVLASNYRGNDGGEGKEEFGGADVADVLRLLELGCTLPQWNGKHSYMAGWSRGGMMTLLAIKAGAHLQAAATIAGITDCISTMHDHADMRTLYDRFIPHTNEEELMSALRERSGVCWPEKIRMPLLIQHGDADERIKVDQAQRLSAQLEALGHPHRTIYYAGGNHFLNAQRPQLLDEIDLFFQAHRP